MTCRERSHGERCRDETCPEHPERPTKGCRIILNTRLCGGEPVVEGTVFCVPCLDRAISNHVREAAKLAELAECHLASGNELVALREAHRKRQPSVPTRDERPLTIPTTDGREVCCAGMLHADALYDTHTDECTPEKRAAAALSRIPTPERKRPSARRRTT